MPEIEQEFLLPVLAVHRYIDLTEQLHELMNRAVEWTGADSGFALIPGEDGRKLELVHGTLDRLDPRWRAFKPVELSRVRRALRDGLEAFDGFGPFEALGAGDDASTRTTVGASVLDDSGRFCGLLILFLTEAADPVALTRLRRLLELCRPALDNARRVEALRQLVIKDDTARCFNRRYFDEFLPEELSRASRFGAALSLIFLDMDNLKQLNNAHGHARGSQSLTEVALRIRGRIRKFDKLFRFGGDEFVIVLPETDWRGAVEVAERVRDAINRRGFLVSELGGDGIAMTASLGVASYPLHARTQERLIEESDRAMQRVKNRSKNAVGVAEIGESDGED